MLPTFITIAVIIAAIVLWVISTRRKLAVLDENISNAMSQIGVQLSGRFDALTTLLELTKCLVIDENIRLANTITLKRIVITAKSTPKDVLVQEKIIEEALFKISVVSDRCPQLAADRNYINTMEAMEIFEKMIRTSRLIYNDSVTKLNREIRMFPVILIAGILGFHQVAYLTPNRQLKKRSTIYEKNTEHITDPNPATGPVPGNGNG